MRIESQPLKRHPSEFEGEVYGSGYSNDASTVVSASGQGMTFTKGATLVLEMPELDLKLIDSSAATVALDPRVQRGLACRQRRLIRNLPRRII